MCYNVLIMQTTSQKATSLSTTLTIRVDKKMKDKLASSAKQQQRSASFIVSEAISGYLALQEWQDARVREAIASADRGEGISSEEVLAWVATLK
jgi:predicted transcriptional regulator